MARRSVTGEIVAKQPQALRMNWSVAGAAGRPRNRRLVVQHNESIMSPDVKTDARHFGGVDEQTGLRLHAMVAVPLRSKQGVIAPLRWRT